MSEYPEIAQLAKLISDYEIRIVPGSQLLEGLTRVDLFIQNHHFILFIEDEYNDLQLPSSELHLCLLLYHLEDYEDADDFLQWCRHLGSSASNSELRSYHLELRTVIPEIRDLLKIRSCPVYYLDYELGSGPLSELRKI